MADLKQTLEALGLERVQTHIQSGNVLFSAQEESAALRWRIEGAIETAFGFPVTTVLRTLDEMEQVLQNCPFAFADLAEGEGLCVAFLAETPMPDRLAKLLTYRSETDECRVMGRDVYLLYRQGLRNSLFTNNFLESKLGVAATTRNWQTTSTLVQLGRAMGE